MLVANFKTKPNSSVKDAVKYVLSEENHLGNKRSHNPEIIKGDPKQLIAISNGFSKKDKPCSYFSGSINFAIGENPTKSQLDQIIQDFEKTFFGSMTNRVEVLYVLHDENNKKHIHFVGPKIDLDTGKVFNPFPPGESANQFRKDFSAIQNHIHGWKQVMEKKSPLASRHTGIELKASKHIEEISSDFRKALESKFKFEEKCQSLVARGIVKNRNELIQLLKKSGLNVNRAGRDYISIEREKPAKNYRLRGGIFVDGDDYSIRVKNHQLTMESPAPFSYKTTLARLNRTFRSREKYNEKRFGAEQAIGKIVINNPNAIFVPTAVEHYNKPASVQKSESRSLTQDLSALKEKIQAVREQAEANSVEKSDSNSTQSNNSGPRISGGSIGAVGKQIQLAQLLGRIANAKDKEEELELQAQIIVLKAEIAAEENERLRQKYNS